MNKGCTLFGCEPVNLMVGQSDGIVSGRVRRGATVGYTGCPLFASGRFISDLIMVDMTCGASVQLIDHHQRVSHGGFFNQPQYPNWFAIPTSVSSLLLVYTYCYFFILLKALYFLHDIEIMDSQTKSEYEAKSHRLRLDLKKWETDWAQSHDGKKPGRNDIKENKDIGNNVRLLF